MTPERAFARRLAAEIEHELARLEQLRKELATAPSADDTFTLRARGSMLHDFYSGIERVFVRIAEELNGGVPQGEQWHRQIVTDMSLEIPGVRPAVIDAALAEELADYLRFRHVFRNVYGSLLQAERMRPLEERLPRVLAAFLTQVRTFLAWMTGEPAD
ncbi:MAG: hypothetical protein F4137_00475 [Acidobacteria bacterium]|nr:hypothetical protein [Acidobacteriota bacterium]MYH27348.1 hypothetical protein [Acidobacteriota bacterium]